ncbi:hypothetical protein [Spiroplasma poulsonii]|uniref:hypothetical protein n=1 Tax=Spiroplasma poulsonii TaxID=2138 RepID=UPI001F4CD39F|nr:hypothetical protein [Spiroplasma poulsonii]UNF62430.1 hypothetical protein MNU24_02895 [Spiroplasma poulsonii]
MKFSEVKQKCIKQHLRDMTTNSKTSFLLPHDYEIPTFNYPQYVLPPVPYNYKPYMKDIWGANTVQPLKTKITAPAQCKKAYSNFEPINLFSNEFNEGYYEIKIDLKQIDPTIQSIDKFISVYKTIEISNLGNLQVECGPCKIENFISNRNVNLNGGGYNEFCAYSYGSLYNITLQESGRSQTDKVNFENTITLYTDNIKANDVQTFATGIANGLPSGKYANKYKPEKGGIIEYIKFLLQITSLSNKVNDKIKETYLQAYYTNDVKLKIRFLKVIFANLSANWTYYLGNDKDITIDIFNPNYLGIINKSDNPVKITIKPR